MAVDYLSLTRKMYCFVGMIGNTSRKRRLLTHLIMSAIFAFNVHAFCNGCILAGLTYNCVSQTIVFIVCHVESSFKLAVLFVRGGEGMAQVFDFVDGYAFVNNSISKHIYVTSFFIILLTVLSYAIYPLVWHTLPFFYETIWGSGSFLAFSSSYLLVFTDLYLIQFVSTLNDFTFLMCADAICVRLNNVKSSLESITGVEDEKKLIAAIKEHQNILRILNYLSAVISPNFFTQVFSTLFIVIFSAYSAMTADFQHFSACLSTFATLLLYCWLGQMVTNATEGLHFASYNNQWYNCNSKMKMDLEIVSLFTREPFEIKGVSVFKMNLQTFKQVMTDSYSYLMLLLTMTDS